MRFDQCIKMDELEIVYLRRPKSNDAGHYTGDHFEVIIRDFLGDANEEYDKCSKYCCLSDDDDYEM